MTDALFLTFIGMAGVFLFLVLVMWAIQGLARFTSDEKKLNLGLVAGAVAVALNENGGENG